MNFLKQSIANFRRKYKKKQRALILTKRQQFVIITVILTAGMLLIQLIPEDWRISMVIALSILAYILSAIVFIEDLKGIEWLTILTLPTAFTAGVALFYFLLPVRWLTRLPAIIFYAIGFYALILTGNIYNIAANRTIALLRAAHSVGFLLTLVVYYFLIQTILSLGLFIIWQVLFIGVISFLLILQMLWAIELEAKINRRVWVISLLLTLIFVKFAWIFYFWPVKSTLIALFLATFFYSSVGMAQQYIQQKLYKKTILEFTLVSGIILILLFLVTRWRTP